MMRRITLRSVACFLLLVMLIGMLAACGGTKTTESGSSGEKPDSGGEKKVYELSLSTADPAEDEKTYALDAFAEAVRVATDGQVQITVFPGGTLAGARDALDAVKQGSVDIAFLYTTFFPGQFPPKQAPSK